MTKHAPGPLNPRFMAGGRETEDRTRIVMLTTQWKTAGVFHLTENDFSRKEWTPQMVEWRSQNPKADISIPDPAALRAERERASAQWGGHSRRGDSWNRDRSHDHIWHNSSSRSTGHRGQSDWSQRQWGDSSWGRHGWR